ncbi:RAC-beta serine/threonine-protein kinase A-like isoform X3 [Convolutriloba macropyga]|uniref:RAC-beta serine/threonine-protein kinase A-like isoform X3 n=1 Tax=Convolutriloba macropyga TaxID=536237 RepID=UPI003F5239CC
MSLIYHFGVLSTSMLSLNREQNNGTAGPSPKAEEVSIDPKQVLVSMCLFKQGEYFPNWRSRHYVLLKDGSFQGFSRNPIETEECSCRHQMKKPNKSIRKLNDFRTKGSVMTIDSSSDSNGKYQFAIEDLCRKGDETIVSRHFYVTRPQDRLKLYGALSELRRPNTVKTPKESTHLKPGSSKTSSSPPTSSSAGVVKHAEPSSVRRNRIREEEYVKLGPVGSGSYGKVYLAEEVATKRLVALKILEKAKLRKKDFKLKHVLSESHIARQVDHPFIAKQYGAGQTPEVFMFVMEFLPGGELYTYLHRNRDRNPFNDPHLIEPAVQQVTAMIASAVEYLHSREIVYRDMKLENLMLDQYGYVKIIDFGISKEIYGGQRAGTFCGTAQYIAPEIIHYDQQESPDEDQGYGVEIDWWTLGIVTYELIYKCTPFEHGPKNVGKQLGQNLLFQRIKSIEPSCRPSYLKNNQVFNISPLLIDFVRGLLDKNPDTRLGDQTVLDHPFLQSIDMDRLKRREIRSYITVEPFNRSKISKYIQKEKGQPAHLDLSRSIYQEENLAGFSYAVQEASFE